MIYIIEIQQLHRGCIAIATMIVQQELTWMYSENYKCFLKFWMTFIIDVQRLHHGHIATILLVQSENYDFFYKIYYKCISGITWAYNIYIRGIQHLCKICITIISWAFSIHIISSYKSVIYCTSPTSIAHDIYDERIIVNHGVINLYQGYIAFISFIIKLCYLSYKP